MPKKFKLFSLEWHAIHSCNLSCGQCSHYSNMIKGKGPTLADMKEQVTPWGSRLKPRKIVILGGEPLMNPEILDMIPLWRHTFKGAAKLIVSNGLLFHKMPELPRALHDNFFKLEVSQHGNEDDPIYWGKFQVALECIAKWRKDFPNLSISVRPSYQFWRRQYQVNEGRPTPFDSEPRQAWETCIQKRCMQLYDGRLWKCPAIAYSGLANMHGDFPLFGQYEALTHTATDDELEMFLNTEHIPQCAHCPSKRIPVRHTDPSNRRLPVLQ